jgi:hypothetical protein
VLHGVGLQLQTGCSHQLVAADTDTTLLMIDLGALVTQQCNQEQHPMSIWHVKCHLRATFCSQPELPGPKPLEVFSSSTRVLMLAVACYPHHIRLHSAKYHQTGIRHWRRQ